ncbi:MAG: crossover junction endodeoxyribonuclease RuvC [Alphaproteobacteria bacterium]|jgi:crossover junction endodeoxyribonuclease RuvC|nr:crossover junction endodeoxyribonuclease RuvC [Alphaproteobacteria bacterium]MDP6589964.1 crossover junction endodeoxyribonuclease RuvC [Alphaproteobacteria bacterium]MDP6816920.1 crossover junction endodeoxyribonuclease RuvC [Alphaproteobacteria bacterium]|tara:strand:- start:112 stop:630 length:519 start_codon:yes stop_codon:yes gene_type:complete
MIGPRRYIGFDPGLRATGWGLIEAEDNRLRHLANGTVVTEPALEVAERLRQLHEGLARILAEWSPDEAAVEETFVNRNARSTLKLGLARGVVLLAPALAGLHVAEYSPNKIKKSVVGAGHADKTQIGVMVRHLLPGCEPVDADSTDALAVAICHAHHAATQRHWPAARAAAV